MPISRQPSSMPAAPGRRVGRKGFPRSMPAVALLLLAGIACIEDPTIPKLGEQVVQVSLSTSTSLLRTGEIDTLTVTVTNTLAEPVQLDFPTLCTVRVFIRDAVGKVQVPAGGVHDCPPIQAVLQIPAGGQVTLEFYWAGGAVLDGSDPASRLPAGNYYASVHLDAEGYSTVGFPVLITLID
jgi:hypothetical protein